MDIKSDGFVSFSLIVIDCFFTNKISFDHRLESGFKFQQYPRLILLYIFSHLDFAH